MHVPSGIPAITHLVRTHQHVCSDVKLAAVYKGRMVDVLLYDPFGARLLERQVRQDAVYVVEHLCTCSTPALPTVSPMQGGAGCFGAGL